MIKKIMIDGMACEHCVKTIKNLLNEIEGVKTIEVGIGFAEIEIENESQLGIIHNEIEDMGYEVRKY